ncbi:hypothetical protein BCR35DRAFT_306625 [Leucosporidium creatinivorum]|uniref:Glutaminase A n=1 Tax=Leucosporidium creatinivorum TaxID=106004 RepID=A0A1Y2EVC8_9BASI|nr:hypothetical protein BCR35DRAFT_306625 [Leucosporidium creatinivorum]
MQLAKSLALAAVLGLAQAGSTPAVKEQDSVPYAPIVVPLANRSPYLGAYLFGSEDKNLALMSPRFWTGTPLGWTGLLRVDGQVSSWMGNLTDWPACINSSLSTDSYSSTFVMTDDPPTVSLTATFLSPITPLDLFRQSLPFSYLQLSVASLDGKDHVVEAYSEINGLWLADDETEMLEWEGVEKDHWSGMRLRLQNQRIFEEENMREEHGNDRILHGDVWYASRSDAEEVETSYAAGDDVEETRRVFVDRGRLYNSLNETFRPTKTRQDDNQTAILDEPVFAISHSFGTVSPSSSAEDTTALITVGHLRTPLIQYKVAGPELVQVKPLWASTFKTAEELIDFFLSDFELVASLSKDWNAQMYADARRVESEEYGHTLAVSTRQIFAALEGLWDYDLDANSSLVTYSPITNEPIPTLFGLKEVSSNGNCQTVDVIAPFLPFLIYASPTLLPLLLEPIYRYSDSGLWKPIPPPHDLGDHWPNALGHDDYEGPTLPIEEAGNMLAMALAGMRRGDAAAREQAETYYHLLTQWADYLIDEALFPKEQSSTDDFYGPQKNQTGLVIKGIMGIRAMAEIALDFEEDKDYAHYKNASEVMTSTFLSLAISKDGTHLLGHYGNDSSWHGQYNLYFDQLFGTEMFPASVYEAQDSFYANVSLPFGPALDSAFPFRAKTDWLAWLGGIAVTNSTRTLFVDAVAKFFRQAKNDVQGDFIDPREGWSVGFRTRPVVGGHFSLLALDVMERLRKGTFQDDDEEVLIGGTSVAVGLLGLMLTVGVVYRWWSRRRRPSRKDVAYEELSRGDASPLLARAGSPSTPRMANDEEED